MLSLLQRLENKLSKQKNKNLRNKYSIASLMQQCWIIDVDAEVANQTKSNMSWIKYLCEDRTKS